MQHQPEEPGHNTGGAILADRDDAIEASYCGHSAFIDVAKWLGVRFASDLIGNHGGCRAPLLHRNLRHSWQRLAILGETGRIPNYKNVRMPWDRRVATDLDAPCPVRLGTSPLSSRGGCDTRCPNDR